MATRQHWAWYGAALPHLEAWRITDWNPNVGELLAVLDVEGLASHEHNKKDHPQGIHVHAEVMLSAMNDFWADEAWGAKGTCRCNLALHPVQ